MINEENKRKEEKNFFLDLENFLKFLNRIYNWYASNFFFNWVQAIAEANLEKKCTIGVVQTAYSNGSSTKFLTEELVSILIQIFYFVSALKSFYSSTEVQ